LLKELPIKVEEIDGSGDYINIGQSMRHRRIPHWLFAILPILICPRSGSKLPKSAATTEAAVKSTWITANDECEIALTWLPPRESANDCPQFVSC
jgi:hypothetical protein